MHIRISPNLQNDATIKTNTIIDDNIDTNLISISINDDINNLKGNIGINIIEIDKISEYHYSYPY